jgi:hypothetical protein
MTAMIDAWLKETEACVGKSEANPGKSDAVAEHQEVPKEEATVKAVRPLNKQCGDQRCEKLKKQTQGNGGSRKKMATTHRGMSHHAGVAWCKGHCCQGHDKVSRFIWRAVF